MLGLLTHWKLIGGVVAGAALAGYIGVLNLNLAHERATVALLSNDLADALGKYETCDNRLRNIMEARRDAETASDPDFVPPAHWVRPDD
jgi:hypothetical protein